MSKHTGILVTVICVWQWVHFGSVSATMWPFIKHFSFWLKSQLYLCTMCTILNVWPKIFSLLLQISSVITNSFTYTLFRWLWKTINFRLFSCIWLPNSCSWGLSDKQPHIFSILCNQILNDMHISTQTEPVKSVFPFWWHYINVMNIKDHKSHSL